MLVLTNHRTLEAWANEIIEDPMGRSGRRDFAQVGDITLSEDAEWRGTVEVPQDLWEANYQMNLRMLGAAVIPTFAQSAKLGEVCIRALADWAACWGESTEKILKADSEIWHCRGNGSCMFHNILNDNNPRIAQKLRCILADFVREQWDFQIPELGIEVGELIEGSGLSK